MNLVLLLNWMTGTKRVFSRIASSHLSEFGFRGTRLVVSDVKPAESLVASFISVLVMPMVLLITTSLIVENHFSVCGSSKDRIFCLLVMNDTWCCRVSALWKIALIEQLCI